MTLNTLKLVYYHSPISILGICIHLKQLWMESEHFLVTQRGILTISVYSKAILDQIWAILPLR